MIIKKNIPIPRKKTGLNPKYSYLEMEVGDCIDCTDVKMYGAACNHSKYNNLGREYTCRKIGETFRVWRTK